MSGGSIVWFRDDLRVADNPALAAAVHRGGPVTAAYVLDERSPGIRPLGAAARWWLHHSITSLAADLRARGIPLVLRHGEAGPALRDLVTDVGADAVFWNRRYAQPERDIDAALKVGLREQGIDVASFAASVLFEPWSIQTGTGKPYGVFTPFWKACLAQPEPRRPLPAPPSGPGASSPEVHSDTLDSWNLLPRDPDWAGGLRDTWTPGETSAHARLDAFLDAGLPTYGEDRDRPDRAVSSRLSPHLRWGELSPHQVWHATRDRYSTGPHALSAQKFLSEVGWREFAWHVLFSFPELATRNWRASFDAFPWPPADPARLRAWQRGRTGVRLVDAGMRELWHTGTMHNRVRMVTASFLTKNLLIHWREGEAWFWDTLVDADAASNPFGWQWVAGSGADAAPYFRIFNPELQATKFDPAGVYVARWAPEYAAGSAPPPIVDLARSRDAALAAYAEVTASR